MSNTTTYKAVIVVLAVALAISATTAGYLAIRSITQLSSTLPKTSRILSTGSLTVPIQWYLIPTILHRHTSGNATSNAQHLLLNHKLQLILPSKRRTLPIDTESIQHFPEWRPFQVYMVLSLLKLTQHPTLNTN